MGQHSKRVGFVWPEIGRRHWLLAFEIANRDGGDLHGRFREPGNAQDSTCRRRFREKVGECLVQGPVLVHIVEIDLEINYAIHGQARSFDDGSYILERLANLIHKARWSGPVETARSLPGDINIVPRVDSWGT